MKKYLLYFIFIFFLFTPFVSAKEFNQLNYNILVKNDGSAHFTVSVSALFQKNFTDFDIALFKVPESKVSNIKVTDIFNTHYEEVDSFQKNKNYFFKLSDQGYKKIITVKTTQKACDYKIEFDLSKFVTKYQDNVYGIDWYVYSRITDQKVGSLTYNINFEDESIAKNIVSNSILGVNESGQQSDSGVSGSFYNVSSSSMVRLLVEFNKNVKFNTSSTSKLTFKEQLEKAKDGTDFAVLFNAYTSRGFLISFAVIIEVGVIVLLLSYIIVKYGTHNEYFGMETADKKTIQKPKDVVYYDSVPCQGDIYKIAFVAGYYKILKSKSDLIGAILFKMYLNDNIEIINGKNGYDLRLRNDLKIDRSLDQDLYNIMMEASDMRVLSSIKTSRFAKRHFLRIMTWFNMGYSETITDEINRGHITRGGKIGKTTKIIFSDVFVDYGNKILGMKKYLLNFNQVPRQSQLSEETYKLLLISAELLGIGKQVAEEILRKNSNNIYAKKLLEFQKIRPIFSEIYGLSLAEYRKTVKNNEIYNYDKMKDASLQSSSNVITITKA